MYLFVNVVFFGLNLYVYASTGSKLALVFTAISAVAIVGSV